MKKLVILFLCLLCLCGCNSIIKEYKKDGVVIEYSSNPNFGSMDDIINHKVMLTLSSNKTIEYIKGKNKAQIFKLTDDEYNEIINYAFGVSFSSLDNDVSDDSIMDGNHEAITIYYEDGTEKTIGGNNPTNKKFNKLVSLLYKYLD